MKHKSIAISGSDLLGRVFRDSDTPWRDVLCWNCEELDKLQDIHNPSIHQEQEIERIDLRERTKVCGLWWVVSWPDHVTSPRFNSDANYSCDSSRILAINHADEVYAR